MTGLRGLVQPGSKGSKVLRVLCLEHSPLVTQRIQANLAAGGIDCGMVRVQTRAAFVAALEDGGFELILADYAVPAFDGLAAMEVAREVHPNVPFILLSDTLGEEAAVETIKSGATDYVLKNRMERLVPVVLYPAVSRTWLYQDQPNFVRQPADRITIGLSTASLRGGLRALDQAAASRRPGAGLGRV